MKLFGFYPNGHGQHSFFVAAEDEQSARQAVTRYITDGPFNLEYQSKGWGTDYYDVFEVGAGEVLDNAND